MKRFVIRTDQESGFIHPFLHAHFAEHVGAGIYGGLWVGENSPVPNLRAFRLQAIEYLKELGVPLLRWPGGCFADDYHWRDGIGSPRQRPKRANASWGGVETNRVGTHEFIDLCRILGAEPYITGNVGTGSPQELRDWIEYCNYPAGSAMAEERAANGAQEPFQVRYWGVGNENWGCGGDMTPELYADFFRRFAVYLRPFGGTELYLIACGPNRDDLQWTERVMTHMSSRTRPQALAMHYYAEGSCTSLQYTPQAAEAQLKIFSLIEQTIVQQDELLNGFEGAMRPRLVLDEWGVHDRLIADEQERFGRLWQYTTMRGALAAGLGLNIFNRHADKLAMCNLAQMVNVRASLLETGGIESNDCVRTPVYYVYQLFKLHRQARSLAVEGDGDMNWPVSISASQKTGRMAISLVNASCTQDQRVECVIGAKAPRSVQAFILHDADLNAYNAFQNPGRVAPKSHPVRMEGSVLGVDVPRLSVLTITAQVS